MNCTKVKFATEKFAIDWIDKLKKTSDRKVKPVRAYLCYHCGAWHLTSKPLNEDVEGQKQKARIKELELMLKAKQDEINDILIRYNNFNKKVNKALNVSNAMLAVSAGYRKEEQKNAFLYGCNKMRELIKSLIK